MVFFLGILHNCVTMFFALSSVWCRWFTLLETLLLLSACAVSPRPQEMVITPAADGAAVQHMPQAAWQSIHLPGKRKTVFTHTLHDGRSAVKAVADRSVSMFRQRLNVQAQDIGVLHFSWKVPGLIEAADMGQRDLDDSPVRLVLVFEGDRSQFSQKNRMLSELSLALMGEELPYATLMYVWCNQCKRGDVIINPRTDRIRKLAVESGKENVGRWLDYERDIRADFVKAFGEEPGALTGIALMTDTDNTQSKATAWYGPISLKPAQKTAALP
jgi:Protein of unknown function (DUF3047)